MRVLELSFALATLVLAPPVPAAEPPAPGAGPPAGRKKIERADQLPVHTYAVPKSVSKVLQSEALTRRLAAELRRDLEADLTVYDVRDAATLREYHGALAHVALLQGRLEDAERHLDLVRELEEKPAVRTISGFLLRAALVARRAPPRRRKVAFEAAVRKQLASFPYEQVQAELKTAKARLEMQSRNFLLGLVAEQLDPPARSGRISKDLAMTVVSVAVRLRDVVPHRDQAVAALQQVIDAHHVEKQDIWEARKVTLGGGEGLTPVVVAIWDTGVDTALLRDRLWVNEREIPGNRADDDANGWVDDVNGIGFTWSGERDAARPLQEVVLSQADLEAASRSMKGWSELQAGLDTQDAAALKRRMSALPKKDVRPFVESLTFYGNYGHGTHVAAIAASENPAVRTLYSRMDWPWQLVPPRPDEAWARGFANAMTESVAYFEAAGARVVNMSWGISTKEIEGMLELSGAPGTAEDRRAQARAWFERIERALREAIASAPGILFVAAAGNANDDARFEQMIPAAFALPNTTTAGAVDAAGDEAAFTSYGNVDVYANGYQVESLVPGGQKQRWSGTSMAAPQVANLAAKILARHPRLTAVQVKEAIVAGADEKRIGERTIRLLNPRRSLELAARAASGGPTPGGR